MNRHKVLAISLAVVGLLFFGTRSALAVPCPGFPQGTLVGNECQVNGAVAATGSFTLTNPPFPQALHICGGAPGPGVTPCASAVPGIITTGAGGIDITINQGDFIMDGGAMIDGNASPTGGAITVTLLDGDVDLATGSIIRSNGPSGGAIEITTTASHTANIDGLVESVGTVTGTGGDQPPGGGTITIIAGCSLTVSDTGKVSSRGADPGADLVHLQACTVFIDGLVESTGAGHVNPAPPHANSCNLTPAAHNPTSAGHSQFFTGCVEIWSGTTVVIDSTGPHKGEVNADVGFTGGSQGRGWIDIYANGDITIKDGLGNDRNAHIPPNGAGTYFTNFAVHSNGGILQNTDDGGLITIRSLGDDVIASTGAAGAGNAIQADATSSGSNGGNIDVEAFKDVTFTSNVYARGDNNGTGGFGVGGTEFIRAHTGQLSWISGIGNVTPTGTAVLAANRGVITLVYCTFFFPGASFPNTGAGTSTNPAPLQSCGPGPTKLTPGPLPLATCIADNCGTSASKCGRKFDDVAGDGVDDASDPGIGNWPINLLTTGNVVLQTITTAADGSYCFLNLQPGTYRACEGPPPAGFVGYNQTFPHLPLGGPANDKVINTCPAPRIFGYEFIITGNETFTGDDFGNHRPVCPEDPGAALTRSVSNPGFSPNYDTVQAAYDAALASANPSEVIGMFGNTVENVTLGGAKNLKITQCTSARITAASNALPVWNITSTGKLTIQGPDSVGGTIGWLIANASGGPHTLKSIRANGASIWGVRINSNGNEVSWNDVSGNGGPGGILVAGNSNKLKGGTVGPNSNDGVKITGNSNSLSGATVESNTGNGVVVSGNNNQIKSNKANLNGTGTTGDGFQNAAGTGNNYSGNSSNTGGKENKGAEYNMVTAGVNGGSNRADGVNIPSAGKCPGFPGVGVCE